MIIWAKVEMYWEIAPVGKPVAISGKKVTVWLILCPSLNVEMTPELWWPSCIHEGKVKK